MNDDTKPAWTPWVESETMRNLLKGAVLASAVTLISPSAFAAAVVFDFDTRGAIDEDGEPIPHNGRDGSRLRPDNLGDLNHSGGDVDQDFTTKDPSKSMNFTVNGLGLTVTGKGTNKFGVVVDQIIRLDAPEEGGLGVMSERDNSLEQVNANRRERLTLAFTRPVRLGDFNFNSGAHNDCPDIGGSEGACGLVQISTNSGFMGTFAALDSRVDDPNDPALIDAALSKTFATQYTFEAKAGGNADTAFYLGGFAATVIPVPAALPLMGTALAALGFVGRRRQRRA